MALACRRLLGLVRQEPGRGRPKLAIRPDRAHLFVFVRVWPTTPANDVVRACEGRTSHDLRRDSPWSKRPPSLWSHGLSAGTAAATIRRDVEAQEGVSARGDADALRLPGVPHLVYPSKAKEARPAATLETARRRSNDLLADRVTAREHAPANTSARRRAAPPGAPPGGTGLRDHLPCAGSRRQTATCSGSTAPRVSPTWGALTPAPSATPATRSKTYVGSVNGSSHVLTCSFRRVPARAA